MDSSEFGTCDMCKKEDSINREYYYYEFECDCCNKKQDPHFEIVRYCNNCVPRPPRVIIHGNNIPLISVNKRRKLKI